MTELDALITAVLRADPKGLTPTQIRRRLREQGRNYPEEILRARLSGSALFVHLGGERYQVRGLEPEVEEEESLPPPVGITVGNLAKALTEYVLFDIETTGITPGVDKVIQLAGLRIRDGAPEAIFFEVVNPEGREIPFALREKLSIRKGDAMDRAIHAAPPITQVLPRFREFVGTLPLIAHNGASFDLPFLRAFDSTLDYPSIDTLELAHLVFPALERRRLEDLRSLVPTDPVRVFGDVLQSLEWRPRDPIVMEALNDAAYHNALFDVVALSQVYQTLLERLRTLELPHRTALSCLLPELWCVLGEPGKDAVETFLHDLTPPIPPAREPSTDPYLAAWRKGTASDRWFASSHRPSSRGASR